MMQREADWKVSQTGIKFCFISSFSLFQIAREIRFYRFSFSVENDYNKRGLTSQPVVRAEIQTSCNFEANICDRSY